MIRYIKNVITGNLAHWNDTHNKNISDLFKIIESLNNIEKIISQESLISTVSITMNYFGPNRNKKITR